MTKVGGHKMLQVQCSAPAIPSPSANSGLLYFPSLIDFFPGLSMSKEQEYDPLISNPTDEFEDSSAPVKLTWTSKFSRTVLVGLLAGETVALAIAIFVIFARGPYTTCVVPLGSQGVLYCGFLSGS